jgi:hypothetical protein
MQQQQSQPQPPAQAGSLKNTTNLVVWLAETVSLPLELLLHDRVGLRFVRLRGFLAAGLIVAFSLLFAGQDLVPLYAFMFVFLGRCLVHGAIWGDRIRKKVPLPPETTRFPGYPVLHRLMPARDHTAVRKLEVVIVLAVGAALYRFNAPLGAYLMAAAVGLAFTLYLRWTALMNRIWDMHDSTVMSRTVADGYREQSGR